MNRTTILLTGVLSFLLILSSAVLLSAQTAMPEERFPDAQFVPTPTLTQLQEEAMTIPVLRAAPELHEAIWLNTAKPLKLADLRGKVILLEMWTFACINCIHTIPSVNSWYDTYQDEGFVVIGNHYPEFSFEHDLNNLRNARVEMEIEYPILQDNDRQTWSAYGNRYWPTMYLIDKRGNIRYVHIGEGRYAETERTIQALLAEPYTPEATTAEPAWSLTPNEIVNVRSGPGTHYEKIGTIQPNEAYYVLDETNGWYKILFDGADAFVFGELVTASK